MRPILAGICALALVAGCARVQVQTYAKPATRERLFGNIKKVAVMPFDTLTEGAAGPKNAENVLIQELLALETFERVEEPRYVNGLMKKLKLRNTESLDREIVQKIGQELQVDAIVVGALYLFGQEEKSEDIEFSVFLNMLDVQTGDIIWSGRTFVRSVTSWDQVLGLQQFASVNDLAAKGILKLAGEIDDQFVDARKLEYKLILEQTPEETEGAETEDEAATPEQKAQEEEGQAEELLLKVAPK